MAARRKEKIPGSPCRRPREGVLIEDDQPMLGRGSPPVKEHEDLCARETAAEIFRSHRR
jgi:hypothetical protein